MHYIGHKRKMARKKKSHKIDGTDEVEMGLQRMMMGGYFVYIAWLVRDRIG